MPRARVDQQFPKGAARHADPEFACVRDQPLDQSGGTLVHTDLAHRVACVHVRTLARLFSTSCLASAALAATARTVHSGSPAFTGVPARGRSAAHSGQSRAGTVVLHSA